MNNDQNEMAKDAFEKSEINEFLAGLRDIHKQGAPGHALLCLGLVGNDRGSRLSRSDTSDLADVLLIDYIPPDHRMIGTELPQPNLATSLALVHQSRLPDMFLVRDRPDHAVPTALIRAFLEDEERQCRQQLPLEVVLRSFDHLHIDTAPNLKPNRADRRSAKHHRRKPQIDHRLKSLRKR